MSELKDKNPELYERAVKNYEKAKYLKQYKGFSKEEVVDLIYHNLLQKEEDGLLDGDVCKEDVDNLDLDSLFPIAEEKKQARKLAKKYLSDYTIETVSDKNTLVQLIYLEITHIRLQNTINNTYEKNNIMPMQMLDSLHKNLREISELKEKLGISRKQLEGQKKDAFEAIELLKKKFHKYREQNQLSRTAVCPHCGQMILFKMRTDKYDAVNHPYFKDRLLFNTHLIKLFLNDKITKKDVANVLNCSEDYVTWMLEQSGKVRKEDLLKEEEHADKAD
jgi:DNA-directed RNA polymerase subunit RPC12/RpoP